MAAERTCCKNLPVHTSDLGEMVQNLSQYHDAAQYLVHCGYIHCGYRGPLENLQLWLLHAW
jgi:hypothetical protein